MARWLLPFKAKDPTNLDGSWDVGIQESYLRLIQNRGHEKQMARIRLVDTVLPDQTLQLYRGWSRPDKDDCFVYVGRPSKDYKSLTIETPAPKGMVFLVFVLPDGTIDEWTWRHIASGTEFTPEDIKGDLLWSMNPK